MFNFSPRVVTISDKTVGTLRNEWELWPWKPLTTTNISSLPLVNVALPPKTLTNPQSFQTTLSEGCGEGKYFCNLVGVSFQGNWEIRALIAFVSTTFVQDCSLSLEPPEILIRTARDFFVGSLTPITLMTAKHRVFVSTHSTYPSRFTGAAVQGSYTHYMVETSCPKRTKRVWIAKLCLTVFRRGRECSTWSSTVRCSTFGRFWKLCVPVEELFPINSDAVPEEEKRKHYEVLATYANCISRELMDLSTATGVKHAIDTGST